MKKLLIVSGCLLSLVIPGSLALALVKQPDPRVDAGVPNARIADTDTDGARRAFGLAGFPGVQSVEFSSNNWSAEWIDDKGGKWRVHLDPYGHFVDRVPMNDQAKDEVRASVRGQEKGQENQLPGECCHLKQ